MLLLFFFHDCETEKGNYFICSKGGSMDILQGINAERRKDTINSI